MKGAPGRDPAARLREALADTPLEAGFRDRAAGFLELRGGDAAVRELDGNALLGLARVLATQAEAAGFLSHRPALLERLACAGPDTLAARGRALDAEDPGEPSDDLEAELDALRLRRREETCLAACLDLGGVAPFEAVSSFLSQVAESITRRALALARRAVGGESFAVLGLGKIAGREFTYHSDLDLIFLYDGELDRIDAASRVGQRLIAYLSTMTGAGVAYAVDTRLRPSGGQGTLVTTLERFEAYQRETAEIWEHVAVLRARAVAGDRTQAQAALDRVRTHVLGRDPRPWAYLADMRARVERERADETGGALAFKTGPGGLMDVDFLAGGALLERGAERPPTLPSVPALLGAAARGPGVEALLAQYRFLRRVEARIRWVAGRAVESLAPEAALRACVAELVEPGLSSDALAARLAEARHGVREAWRAVTDAGSITALER